MADRSGGHASGDEEVLPPVAPVPVLGDDLYGPCRACHTRMSVCNAERRANGRNCCVNCGHGSATATRADALRQFHFAYGVPVRDVPTTDIEDHERLLRARLVFEEALEFVVAMGCRVGVDRSTGLQDFQVHLDHASRMDLIEAADALADVTYVVEGSAVQLGIDLAPVFREVHRSNMSKLGADGKPIYRPGDNKVLKGPDFFRPDLEAVLREQGWEPDATAARP